MKSLALAAVVVFGGTFAAQEPVYTKNDQVSNPVVVVEKKPAYTKAAMEKKIQGAIELSAIIDKEGKPTEIRVVKSLDSEYGLDDSAVSALKGWRFKPALKDGEPVRFLVSIEMTFTLRGGK